jgi:hypothetical protein
VRMSSRNGLPSQSFEVPQAAVWNEGLLGGFLKNMRNSSRRSLSAPRRRVRKGSRRHPDIRHEERDVGLCYCMAPSGRHLQGSQKSGLNAP